MPNWLTSVGMEVHVELNTRSKMFCRCPVDFGGAANTRVCPVCLGLPGALPVPNKAAIEKVLRVALALNCQIASDPLEVDPETGKKVHHSIFHRKNYFYPDLPKGYQISQYGETNPMGYGGWLDIPAKNGGTKRIRIRRVHLEEDTGKLIHLPDMALASAATSDREAGKPRETLSGISGIDYNRAGVPLMEIVTDFPPDIENAEEAKEYLVQLREILLYLDVSDCKMEEGSMRCEPNISIRPEGSETFGVKTEIKNLNSFRSVQLGVEHEVKRQAAVLESGGNVLQETRGWNEERLETFPQRLKEFEADYRYFPDPDLLPMQFGEDWIEELRTSIPELPLEKSRRYQQEFALSAEHAGSLVAEREWAGFFEEAVAAGGEPKAVCNWMMSEFAMFLNADGIGARASKVTPAHVAELAGLVLSDRISGKIGKDVFRIMYESGQMPAAIVSERGLEQVSDSGAIEKVCKEVISEHPEIVLKYKSGQNGVLGFLIGRAIQRTGGSANPKIVQETLKRLVEEA